jgi:ABC-type nitrate/sulfonate/bicarbonate transport system permease component
MTYYSNFFQVANYFAALLVFIMFSVAATEAARLIEHRYSRWRAE